MALSFASPWPTAATASATAARSVRSQLGPSDGLPSRQTSHLLLGCSVIVVSTRVCRKLLPGRSKRSQVHAQGPVPLGNIFDAAVNQGGRGMGGGFVGPGPGDMFGGQKRSPEEEEKARKVLQNIRDFRMKPKEVKEYLDRFVIEQDDAKKVLRCLDDPSLRGKNYTKPNILISGPTGSGKTYLVRTMAKMLGVPFAKADATKFSETGIVGEDAEDVVRQLVDSAGGSSEVAQYGMVYIDEVDKICSGSGGTARGGWNGSQVQSNFLKIMEDTEVGTKNSMQASLSSMFGGGQADQTISTKFVLFIFSGAFNGMNEIIKNRVGTKPMGFFVDGEETDTLGLSPSKEESQSYLHLAETKDFVEAGLEPEFVGRIPVRVAIRALTSNDLYRILTEAEDSVLLQFQNDFDGYGIQLKAEEAALRRVAELAVEERTGARALVTILEKVLRGFKFELPSTSCKELLLTKAIVEDPQGSLQDLLCAAPLARASVQRWLETVERTSKIRLDMPDDVRDRIVEECAEQRQAAETVLDRRLRQTGVISGFESIRDATKGKVDFFCVNQAMLDTPAEEMQKWTKDLDAMA
ncbi:clpX [Symbiodinium microadriaticum]|nr:clpX [Symbiodinium microadriaticum]CAE7511508.1 clpX [Symbiodinium sp. KB8]